MKAHAPRPRGAHQCQADLRLALKGARLGGHPGFVAARGVIAPLLGQIQTPLGQGHAIPGAERGKDADLAVIHLAQPPVILPGDTHGGVAFFTKGTLINNEVALRQAAEQAIGLGGDPVEHLRLRSGHPHLRVIPGRVGDKMVDLLMIAARHRVGDVFEVALTGLGLHEAAQVEAGLSGGDGGTGCLCLPASIGSRARFALELSTFEGEVEQVRDGLTVGHEASPQFELGSGVIFFGPPWLLDCSDGPSAVVLCI